VREETFSTIRVFASIMKSRRTRFGTFRWKPRNFSVRIPSVRPTLPEFDS